MPWAPAATCRHPVAAVGRAPLVRPVSLALAAAGAGRGPLRAADVAGTDRHRSAWPSRCRSLSVRFVEDPVRHSRWLAVAPRSLALGARRCAVLAVIAVGLAAALVGGDLERRCQAAAPDLDSPPRRAVADAAAATVVAAPPPPRSAVPTTRASRHRGDHRDDAGDARPAERSLAALVASTQRALAVIAGAAPVPTNLDPSLAAARDRSAPYDDGCVNVGVNRALQPCEYGVTGLRPHDPAVRRLPRGAVVRAARADRPRSRLPPRDPDQGRVPGGRRERADPNLHFTCPPYRDRVIDWIAEQPAGPRRGGELLHAVPGRRRRVGGRHRRDDRAARRGVAPRGA